MNGRAGASVEGVVIESPGGLVAHVEKERGERCDRARNFHDIVRVLQEADDAKAEDESVYRRISTFFSPLEDTGIDRQQAADEARRAAAEAKIKEEARITEEARSPSTGNLEHSSSHPLQQGFAVVIALYRC